MCLTGKKKAGNVNRENSGKPKAFMAMAILSRACDTSQEGAETSGEV